MSIKLIKTALKTILLVIFSFTLYGQEGIKSFNEIDSNSLKQGIWYSYYLNGKVCKTENYLDDKKHGTQQEFYENGVIKKIENFRLGKLEGVTYHFLDTGILNFKSYFEKNKKIGTEIHYYWDGTIEIMIEYDNFGRKIYRKTFSPVGDLGSLTTYKSKKDYTHIYYNENGEYLKSIVENEKIISRVLYDKNNKVIKIEK